jgi:hypothetical protein
MSLRVNDEDVLVFADAHDAVAGEVAAAARPDPSLIPALTSGYGPVGAELTAAVEEFQAAFEASGTALSDRFRSHASNLRTAAAGYVGTDEDGAAAVHGSAVI